ncbi:MAG: radical SAM protein, partial [Candidatus Omnitrophica bacterium]|nr:radical SAM protein [Candidatus Omnitrophota bacterium]
MNITLIYPLLSRRRSRIDENKQFWPPLGLAYIAAVLEKGGHRVQIIDRDILLRKNGMDFDKVDSIMMNEIRSFGSTLIGISATTPNMSDVGHISRYIKKSLKEAFIVLGGPHVSGEPILSLVENPEIDIAVKGEGEFALLDIANGKATENITGIYYRKNGEFIANAPRDPIKDIDELPMPARHLLDMKFYTRPSRFTSRNLSLRTTSIFTARGCPYRCNFCAGPLVFSGKVRFHSPARVLKEIEYLISNYNVEALYFAEDMFLSSKQRAEELLNLFIDKGINKKIRWFAQAKASIITSELLQLMKEAGCVGIEYGFESGSQMVLDLMNKRQKVEESLRAAELTRRARMRFQANIIVGYPGEREDDFKKTIDFIRKVRPSMIGFNVFMPLPGTPSYEKLKDEGKALPKWDDIGDPEAPQINYADMPKETFERLYLEARLKVILPMNLRSFLADNWRNPFRLAKVAMTQFKGVIVKTFRSIRRLKSFKKVSASRKKVLFLSYNGLLEPILPSQAVPYMKELSKRGYDFILMTYEKRRDLNAAGRDRIKKLKQELKVHHIEWKYLIYHKKPPVLSTFFDLFLGTFVALWVIARKRVKIIHVRGITPGVMVMAISRLLLLNVRVLFDMRGLLAEEYVGGGLWKEDSIQFKLVKKAEERMLKTTDAITVLTNKHLCLNKTLDYVVRRNVPMDVIPCCVDTRRFDYNSGERLELKKKLGVEKSFILMYPGKIGTFYMINEMIDFFKAASDSIPESVFIVVTNDEPSSLLEKARKTGIDIQRLRIIQGVPFENMLEYLRIADAGLFFINP